MSVILEEALKLPVAERRRLADDIYESIDTEEQEFILTPEHEAELARRVDYSKLHPEEFSTWEEVRERLWKRG